MRLKLIIDTPAPDRYALLDRRDEIVAHLLRIGIRLSMTEDGTSVYLVDGDLPSMGELAAGSPYGMHEHDGYTAHSHEVRADHRGVAGNSGT